MNRKSFEEHIIHGTLDFPVAVYRFQNTDNVLFPIHYHREFEFLILTEGKAEIQIENAKIILEKGEGVFINSGLLHSAVNLHNKGYAFTAILFSPDFITDSDDVVYKKYILPVIKNELIPTVKLSKDALDFANLAAESFFCAERGYELYVKGSVEIMLSMCIAHAESCTKQKYDFKYEIVKNVMNFIHENYAGNITLFEMAQCVHVSREYLCRIFRNVTGDSPIGYLIRYRILKSAYLLTTTDKSVSEISSHCGFNNSSYFNLTFRRMMDCTPKEYRKTHQI